MYLIVLKGLNFVMDTGIICKSYQEALNTCVALNKSIKGKNAIYLVKVLQ